MAGETAGGISREISTQASDSGGEEKEPDNRGDPQSPERHMERSDCGNVEMKEKRRREGGYHNEGGKKGGNEVEGVSPEGLYCCR